MSTIHNPFQRRLIEAERKFLRAKHEVALFEWLVKSEVPANYAKTIVDSEGWDAVLESSEFEESEKIKFRAMVRAMQNEMDENFARSVYQTIES